MVDKDILFVFGAPRSGTTFLNSLLRDYFDFGMCAEGQWVLATGRRLNRYGNLSIRRNMQRLIDDIREDYMFEHIRTIHSESAGRPLDVTSADIWKYLPEQTYPGLIFSVFYAVAQQLGAKRIGNKCPDYWEDLPALLSWFPKAKFLHIIRDGRDVALSVFQRLWGNKTALGSAYSWIKCQETTRAFAKSVPPQQYCEITYESLLISTDETIATLEKFLDATLDCGKRSTLLAAVSGSGMNQNFGKWKMNMSPADQRMYEAVAGEWLRTLGYETVCDNPTISWIDCTRSLGREYYAKAKLRFLSLGSKYPLD